MPTDYLATARKILAQGPTPQNFTERAQKLAQENNRTGITNAVLKVLPQVPSMAFEAARSWLESAAAERSQMTFGEKFMTDVVRRPLKIATSIPRAITAGLTNVGKDIVELLNTKVAGKTKQESRRNMSNPELDQIMVGMETKPWQQVKDEVDAYTAKSPIAKPWEKENLGTMLAVAGFAADAFVEGGAGKKLTFKVLKELAEEADQTAIERILIREGIPHDVAQTAKFAVSEAKTPEHVEAAIKRSSQAVLNRLEAGAREAQSAERRGAETMRLDLGETSDRVKVNPALRDEMVPGRGASRITIETPKLPRVEEAPKPGQALTENVPKMPKAVRPLAEEVRKYKSAEEFIATRTPVEQFTSAGKEGKYWAPINAADSGYGPTKNTAFVDESKLYQGQNSRDFLEERGLLDASLVKRLDSAAEGSDPNLEFKITQDLAEEVLKKEGYSGAHWSSEDDLNPTQYQIWDKSAVNSKEELTSLYSKAKEEKSIPEIPGTERGDKFAARKAREEGRTPVESPPTEKPPKPKAPPKEKPRDIDLETLDIMAKEDQAAKESEYFMRGSPSREESVTADLETTFAALKGVNVEDLHTTFTKEDLEGLKAEYEFLTDYLNDHPGRALLKFRSKKDGEFVDLKDPRMAKTAAERVRIEEKNKRVALGLEKATEDKAGYGSSGGEMDLYLSREDPDFIRTQIDDYIEKRDRAKEALENLRQVRKSIQLAKQTDEFVGNAKAAIAREAAKGVNEIRALVKAAERAGYRKGVSAARGKYDTLVMRLKNRRLELKRIQKDFNLTDGEMKKAMGRKDPRFMKEEEFETYKKGVLTHAERLKDIGEEHQLLEILIDEKGLKKVANLQKALQLPTIDKMSLEQLREFKALLSDTEANSTFLSPRMIQTAKNTDLGEVKTVEEAVRAVVKQTGMPDKEVAGDEAFDRMARIPTLYEKDPLHRVVLGEWIAREADLLTKKTLLRRQLNTLYKAARKSARIRDAGLRAKGLLPTQGVIGGLLERLAPQDRLITKWLQPFEYTYVEGKGGKMHAVPIFRQELKDQAESLMTAEELKAARFAKQFFGHYHNLAQQKSIERWTLLGVKHSKYKDIYLPHISPRFFEQWRNIHAEQKFAKDHPGRMPEGRTAWMPAFFRAVKRLWDKNVDDRMVDWNAYGDKGEVLGLEKWLNRSMTRTGPGENKLTGQILYSQNVAKAMLSYFDAFERKLVLDSLLPKMKLMQMLFGKKIASPKHIGDPEGALHVDSLVRQHWNELFNTFKGQRIKTDFFGFIPIRQGSQIEAAIEASRTWITLYYLGIHIPGQFISGFGNEAINLAGLGIKGLAKGHARSITKAGKNVAKNYPGIIGEAPWREFGDAAQDAGETIQSSFLYFYGDFSYRARREFFLALLTKDELKTGIISAKRQEEIKVEIGKWHQIPEFSSIVGKTAAAKAAGMFAGWTIPIIQNVYFTQLPRAYNMLKRDPDNWAKTVLSSEFQKNVKLALGSLGLAITTYWLLNPDKNDASTEGYMRRKAANEISSISQSIFLWGVPLPGMIYMGYFDRLRAAIVAFTTGEKYTSAGPGHKEGDFTGLDKLGKQLIPRGVGQARGIGELTGLIAEEETPIESKKDIAKEILRQVESGELSANAAKDAYKTRIDNRATKLIERSVAMSPKEYAGDLVARIESSDLTVEEAKQEWVKVQKKRKDRDPESFEADSDTDFIGKVKVYAEAIGTDPVTAFSFIFQGEGIRRTDNGAIIVSRMSYEESQQEKKDRGATKGLILDHTIPLELGGGNDDGNLQLVPEAQWERYTPIENYLGNALRNKEVSKKKAQDLIRAFKNGEIDEADVYAAF